MKKKILLIFGTRPEAIKMAPIYLELSKNTEKFHPVVCVTGQHREMLDQVLQIFNIKPDIDLNIMKKGQDLFDITSSIILEMRQVLIDSSPDLVMVHGDTSTSMASAIAAFYSNIKIWHVEAGLRTNNIKSPFPEEFNRQLVSKISNIHLAPTKSSKSNLILEGVNPDNIFVTGNTVIDSLHITLENLKSNPNKALKLIDKLVADLSFDFTSMKFILITGHRRENFGEGFQEICKALKALALKYPDFHFVYPVHMNPNVIQPVALFLEDIDNIHLIKPLDYESFILLMENCYLVLTDSGGIQEEAPSLGKPVLVMRDSTERPEAVLAGTVILVGANQEGIIENVSLLIDDELSYDQMSLAHNPYGNGEAAKNILTALMQEKYN